MHNGTYTTMANNKKGNRKTEFAIRAAEIFATIACVCEGKNTRYNRKMFDEFWRKIMLFQFHDVLPGTSVAMVYEETGKWYPLIMQGLKEDMEKSFNVLLKYLPGRKGECEASEDSLALFNSLPFSRTPIVSWDDNGKTVYSRVQVPQVGFSVYPKSILKKHIIEKTNITVNDKENIEVESDLLKVVLSKRGRLLSLKDKETMEYNFPETMRETVSRWNEFKGANVLLLHDDIPELWDAWDLCVYYDERYKELLAEAYKIEKRPHEILVKFRYRVSEKSIVEQTVIISAFSKRIDFSTNVDWHECHKILRTYFPVNVKSDYATCDIQNGQLKRPSVSNTSWDVAKYEVCCHKFIDMSEAHYGVALMSDSKYGYSARGNVLGMSLLKSSKIMYEQADMGKHSFTYSLLPHIGSFAQSEVTKVAYELNEGIYQKWTQTSLKSATGKHFIDIDDPHIALDALKLDEAENKKVVIRVHEDIGGSSHCTITPSFAISNPKRVNILENDVEEWEFVNLPIIEEAFIRIDLSPYQIVTYKLDANIK